MSADDHWQAKAGPLVFRLGVAVFAASLLAGVVRSLSQNKSIPGVGVEYFSELNRAFQTKGYDETLPWMSSALRIDLDNETAARELLEAARQAGDDSTAVRALEKLVRLQPEDPDVRTELVSGLLSEGRAVEAYAHGAAAVRLDPESSVAWSNLGAAAMGLDQKREAAELYRRALQLDPANESARRALDYPLRGY
jgi:tetratricopeptide (TPR) repeat protein